MAIRIIEWKQDSIYCDTEVTRWMRQAYGQHLDFLSVEKIHVLAATLHSKSIICSRTPLPPDLSLGEIIVQDELGRDSASVKELSSFDHAAVRHLPDRLIDALDSLSYLELLAVVAFFTKVLQQRAMGDYE